eukprot:TRINITY_DN1302_c0_g1_i5.p1 TRINITY_DN1302_c0_g1~~TRINITY_DN1302_c0_g1_i5.p1  ORF type:complete len:391 (+),score=67.13 TRINITY_DN1302_c0_g1_i5:369-1541(+)
MQCIFDSLLAPSRPLPSAEAFQPFSEKKRNTPVFGTPVPQTPFKRPASHDSKSIKQLENQLLDIFPIEDGKDQWELMKSTKTSTIYKVREKLSNKLFVLKKLNPKVVGKYNDKRKECIHGKNLNHFNLVKYYEFWKVPSVIYFKIEYCPGGSLEDYLIRNSLEGNPTEKPELWNFFLDLALGLQYIHVNGYVHLDIKPGNIFLVYPETSENSGKPIIPRLKIGDFGNMQLAILGNRRDYLEGDGRYLAPEVLSRQHMVNSKSDIYSLGLLVYEMATNYVINSETNEVVSTGVLKGVEKMSEQLHELVKRMIVPDPSQRCDTLYLLQSPRLNMLRQHLGFEIPTRSIDPTPDSSDDCDAMDVSEDSSYDYEYDNQGPRKRQFKGVSKKLFE